jgi:hypothetical protein
VKVKATSDAAAWTHARETRYLFDDLGLEKAFDSEDYGPGLSEIFVVFMCRTHDLEFKQRIRMDRKELVLYMDIFLDYHLMVKGPTERRWDHVARKLYDELPPILAKYKLKDFDTNRFIADFRKFMEGTGMMKPTK